MAGTESGGRRGRRGNVEVEPVVAEQLDGLAQAAVVEGLAHVAVGAQQGCGAHVALLGRSRQDHHRQQTGARVFAQFPQDFEAVDLGQVEVEERHPRQVVAAAVGVGVAGKEIVQSLHAIAAKRDHVFLDDGVQGIQDQPGVLGRILGQQQGMCAQENLLGLERSTLFGKFSRIPGKMTRRAQGII